MEGSKNIHAAPVKGGIATEEDVSNLLHQAGDDEQLVAEAVANVRVQREEIRPPLTTGNSNARVEGGG